jgi:UDP-2,3-diacylglucosamine hydrolase
MIGRSLFISDIHLLTDRPKITEIFMRFLETEAHKADALYILGDLFEVWIGDDDETPLHKTVIQALRALVDAGIPVYCMHGNRDFLLGKRFMQQSGCILLPDPSVIVLYGTPTLISHGDIFCTRDKQYMKFRKKTRNKLVQKLFLLKSLAKRRAIADQLRETSKAYIAKAEPDLMDVAPETVEQMMRKYKVRYLIHGHTHKPTIEQFMLDNHTATRVVLDTWNDVGNVLVCTPNSELSFTVHTLL